MALKWYEFRSATHGTITIKGRSEAEARAEAAERKNCSEDELVCTGHSPYYRVGIPEPPNEQIK